MFSRVPLIRGRWLQAFKPVAISVIALGAWWLLTLPLSGAETVTLPNGDYLVVDPDYDLPGSPPVPDVGAVYHHQAGTGQILGMLTGSKANDQIGSGGITVFGNGLYAGFLVRSPLWDNGAATDAGAVSMGVPAQFGPFDGVVSAANSLVGSTAGDQIGSGGITVFGSDSFSGFVVSSPLWDNGTATDAGAVSMGVPAQFGPVAGAISASNSLVGSTAGDQIGSGGITPGLAILSPLWDNGPAVDAGAVTFGNPAFGPVAGVISASNSLVGSSAGDQIGSGGITLLGPGFLVRSPQWDNGPATDAGAVTSGHLGFGPVAGVISASNSLVGSSAGDQIGSGGITPLGDVGFLIRSPQWDNGSAVDAGAVTFAPTAFAPVAGVISASNSFVGSTAGDQVGSGGVTALVGGPGSSFLIQSPLWDNGSATDAGAVTLGFLSPGMFSGVISASNSFVGSSAGDQVGSGGITLLGGGVFLVHSPQWDNGPATDAGAVTFGHPAFGPVAGVVSASNSFVGSTSGDQIGSGGITILDISPIFGFPPGSGALAVLIQSPLWDNGSAIDAGAITITVPSPGAAQPSFGIVSVSNSIVGSTSGDQIGSGGITILGSQTAARGVLIRSPLWDNGSAINAGAVTFWPQIGPGPADSEPVSASNSLVGSSAEDQIGSGGITVFGSSDALRALVYSPQWDNGSAVDAGAFTVVVPGAGPIAGVVSAGNSLVGSSTGDQIGSGGVFPITVNIGGVSTVHGFIAQSPLWDHGPAMNAGAVTVIGGQSGPMTAGLLSAANSMVGSHPGDQVGSGGFSPRSDLSGLDLLSPHWCYGAGAATPFQLIPPVQFGSWAGVVSAANSTVGAETAEPEIVLRQPSPTEVPSGSSRDFGGVAANATSSLTFTIHNTGTDDLLLNGLPKVAVTGADAALFTIVSQPRDLIVTGDSATFTVNFTPTGTGTKTAQLSIATNDSDESPYVIQLTGTVLLPISDWRQTHFGSSANSGNAADTADFDHDGVANILEYAFGLHPGQNSAGQLPLPARNGGDLTVVFNQPAHVSGVVYEAEWCTSLAPTSWLPVPDTGVPPLHVFTVPAMGNTQVFMRFKVSPSL